MAKYRSCLPPLANPKGFFLTDAGLETVLIFEKDLDLPEFASFSLLQTESGRKELNDYPLKYWRLAKEFRWDGFIIETPTWRANPDWAAKLSIDPDELVRLNKLAVKNLLELRQTLELEPDAVPLVISGNLGPRGDGYVVTNAMSAEEAMEYHALQIRALAEAGVDCIAAVTLTYSEEAIGIVQAATTCEMPCIIAFTVETDGTLPSGQSLKDAIIQTDMSTDSRVAYYMINCAHPTHFKHLFEGPAEPWMQRVRGLRCNSSSQSHAELDASPELDAGDPMDLGRCYGQLKKAMPQLCVFGGCCGTNELHLEQVCITLNSLKD